jgi:preprotein translocase subunit YajC
MKTFTLLQTGEVVENATAGQNSAAQEGAVQLSTEQRSHDNAADGETAAADQPQGGNSWSMWIMLALIFGVMWFFMIRPQKKQQKELQKFRDSLQKGDKVVTIGGIYGTVVEVKDATVLVEVDNGVKVRFSKQALVKDFTDPQQ